jgi:hypothetical protein
MISAFETPQKTVNKRAVHCTECDCPITMESISHSRQSEKFYWVLALLLGAIAGWTHARLNDASLSVLMVTGFAMFLAYKCPQRMWWWAVLIGLSLPSATMLMYITRDKPSLGMVAGSFAGLAFSIVAAVGGKVFRNVVGELFPPKSPPAATEK